MDWRDEPVPPQVVEAAGKHRLGVLLTSARTSGLSPAVQGMSGLALVVVIAYLVSMVGTALNLPGPVLTVLALVGILGGLVVVLLVRSRGRALYLFEGGAVVVRDGKHVLEVVPWAEMVPVEVDQRRIGHQTRNIVAALTISGARGKVFACIDEVAVRLADVIASVEAGRAWAALRAGRSVVYGPLTLTPTDLVVSGTAVPWAHVTQFRCGELWFVVRGAGPVGAPELARVPRATVPHQRTVIALGERMGAEARQPHSG